ncbi:MAG: diguanylate cyclase [Nitrospirae bacterium]|nr:diguanylate cyclase [Nitrospirota bacterium]
MNGFPLILYVGRDQKVLHTFKGMDVHVLNESEYDRLDYDRVLRANPELAVVDHTLNAREGFNLFKKLRDLQPGVQLPILMLTEENSPLFRAKCMDLGADEVLSKPINPIEFLSVIRSSLRKRREFVKLHQEVSSIRQKVDQLHKTHDTTRRQKVDLADDLLKAEQVKQFFRNINLLDLKKVYERIREQLPTLLEVELFSLFVMNQEKGTLELAVHNHTNLSEHLVLHPNAGGVMFDAVKEDESFVITNPGLRRNNGDSRAKYKHTDALFVPLKVGGETVGILNLNNSLKGRFSEQDKVLADQVAQFLATILCNVRLYQKVRALSTMDGLTGLLNHLNLHKRLYVELLRALRYQRPLSCIMLDLDHFKLINDTYGHQAGDRILKDVSEIIQTTVREVDIAARYGGEEFFIILPETAVDEAQRVAERMRDSIAKHSFFAEGHVIKVTASFGVASFPQAKIMHKNQLIRHADQALYEAKNSGRDRVCTYQERRVAQRYKVEMELKYLTQEVRTVRSAILNNISATGTSVAVYEPLAQGTAVWLEMKVTTGNGNGQTASAPAQPGSMKAQGEVVWCRPAVEVSGMYEVGIQFRGLEDEKKKALTKIVYTALFKDVSQLASLPA